ncbi:Nucleotide-binding universal stress protein, UspA family [Cyclobacterium xiamenense]|uniref:Nucleotide-binding universal stress protein, UspA family n=1 Tax=Cyclobacterium xiamenense TaxID=1297121 RepID=A0A1H6UCW6_9BACT|nr:universal stress protein [Cyclobacterium xiamenense]SEI90218.1 Nucleotide-binding universal stress protein, UspA family [Cyclobacterium xiamenense]
MKTYTILCPTDFSECSLNAIEYAAKLGEKWNANLFLLHVPDKEDYEKLFPGAAPGEGLQTAKKKLESLVAAVREESLSRGLNSCSGLLKEGKTISTILNCAEVEAADLIVMGTEGINEFKKNYIGTKSSKVVQSADCDVFIVPRKVFFKIPRKVVYATNYQEEDKLAIQRVVDFAKVFDSELDVVHVSTRIHTIDKALHLTMVEEVEPFVAMEKVNFVLKSYRDDPGLGLENYLITAKGNVLFTLSKKKTFFEQLFTKNLSKKMSYFINKPLYVIKRL